LDKNVTQEDLLTKYRLTNGRTVSVLCDGYPINFIIGDGIAKSVIDPILTELIAGATLLSDGTIRGAGIQRLPKKLEEEIWKFYRTVNA
jgi:S-adenosylhomocysteine hydrolase